MKCPPRAARFRTREMHRSAVSTPTKTRWTSYPRPLAVSIRSRLLLPDRVVSTAKLRSCEKMRFAGGTACATNGKWFACIGGAGAFGRQFRLRADSLASQGALDPESGREGKR